MNTKDNNNIVEEAHVINDKVTEDNSSEFSMITDPNTVAAQIMIDSKLLPEHIKTAEQAVTIMQYGKELDFSPSVAFQRFFIAPNGKLGMDGVCYMALLRKGGVQWITSKDMEVIYSETKKDDKGNLQVVDRVTEIKFQRKNLFSNEPIEELSQFSYKDAVKAELVTSKSSAWKKYLRTMMWWRCFTLGARRIAGDLLMGMHTIEEVDDSNTIVIDELGEVKKIKSENKI